MDKGKKVRNVGAVITWIGYIYAALSVFSEPGAWVFALVIWFLGMIIVVIGGIMTIQAKKKLEQEQKSEQEIALQQGKKPEMGIDLQQEEAKNKQKRELLIIFLVAVGIVGLLTIVEAIMRH